MNIRLSSKEQEELVLKNQRLVYHLVNKLEINNPNDYDDMVSIGTIGLIKAAATFDKSKKIKFATYASHCVNNELFMHFRKEKRCINTLSLDEVIFTNDQGQDLTLGDITPSPEKDFTEELAETEIFIKCISIILNLLESKERLIMLYEIAGNKQEDIAKKFNISRAYVSILKKRLNKKVKSYLLDTTKKNKEVFSMAIVGESYEISFASKEVKHFNKIFATLLENLTTTEDIPDFKVNCSKERIIVQIPAHPESFSFIAKIIQEIDDFSMNYSQKVKMDNTNENNERMKEDTISTVEKNTVDTNSVEEPKEKDGNANIEDGVSNSTGKRDSQAKRIRDYVLSMDTFTVKELRQHFPDLTAGAINTVLIQAKAKGLITPIVRGKYQVTKN